MMKKMILAVAFVLSALTISAQPMPRSEVSVSYAIFPATTWIDQYSEILVNIFTNTESNFRDWGAVSVGYNYRVTKRLSVGFDVAYSTNTDDIMYQGKILTTIDNRYWSLMPNLRYSWLNKGIVSLYSHVGAGVTFANSKAEDQHENRTHFAFQFSPIGIQLGGNLAGFAELGLGMSGCIMAGVRYRF